MRIDPKSIPGLIDFAFNVSHNETISNRRCRQYCEFIKATGREPKDKSKDPTEKRLARWRTVKIKATLGTCTSLYYPSDLTIAKEYGFPHIFKPRGTKNVREAKSNQKCEKCCRWIKKHHRMPSSWSKSKIERQHAIFIKSQRQCKKRPGTKYGTFYASNQSIAEKYILPDLFDIVSNEQISNQRCIECCEWYKTHRQLPSAHSTNRSEKTIRKWLDCQRTAKLGKKGIFYSSNQAIAEKYGYPDLFELSSEKQSNSICVEVCEWIIKHGNRPLGNSKDPAEKRLYNWLHRQCKAIQSPKTSSVTIYESNMQIANEYGLSDLFKHKSGIDREQNSNNKCRACCEWIKVKNRKPMAHSRDKVEKSHGIWLNSQLQAKRGTSAAKFYKSNIAIAKKYGFADLFS